MKIIVAIIAISLLATISTGQQLTTKRAIKTPRPAQTNQQAYPSQQPIPVYRNMPGAQKTPALRNMDDFEKKRLDALKGLGFYQIGTQWVYQGIGYKDPYLVIRLPEISFDGKTGKLLVLSQGQLGGKFKKRR